MMSKVADETILDDYQKGVIEGYGLGIAAALEQIRLLATNGDIPVPPSRSSMDRSIDELGLTARAHNRLFLAGIRTVRDIYTFHNDKLCGLRDIRNLGQYLFEEINDRLVELGYPELRRIRYL